MVLTSSVSQQWYACSLDSVIVIWPAPLPASCLSPCIAVVAAMSSKALAIDLEATDRGLLTCLIGSRLEEKYAKGFVLKYKLEALEVFGARTRASSRAA